MSSGAKKEKDSYWLDATMDKDSDELLDTNSDYVAENINKWGESGVSNELKVLKDEYQKDDNTGGYEIVIGSAQQLLANLDETVNRDSFPTQYGNFLMRYSTLIGACDDYLKSHSGFRWTSTGRGRVKSIKKMFMNAQHEVLLLQTASGEAASLEEAVSWRELMFGKERASKIDVITGLDGHPDYSAEASGYVSIMSAESFIKMSGDKLKTEQEREIYKYLKLTDNLEGPELTANNRFLDKMLELIGGDPSSRVMQLLYSQIQQRKEQSGSNEVLDSSINKATLFANEAKGRTAMRDSVISKMEKEGVNISPAFKGSGEFSRVPFRMDTENEETSRKRLENEMAYQKGKNSAKGYDEIKSGVSEELRAVGKFRLLDLGEDGIMEKYEEISKLEMSAMHISDIGKLKNPANKKSLKSEVYSEMGLTEEMSSCITALLGAYQQIGRGLWSVRALEQGWIPTTEELTSMDKKHLNEFMMDNGMIDSDKYRAYIEKFVLDMGRRTLDGNRKAYGELIPQIMSLT